MRALLAILIGLMVLAPRLAPAHELTIAEMEVRESTPGELLWQWNASEKVPGEELTIGWPEACQQEEAALHCGKDGLRGSLEVKGVGQTYSAVMVKVFWLDGQSRVYT